MIWGEAELLGYQKQEKGKNDKPDVIQSKNAGVANPALKEMETQGKSGRERSPNHIADKELVSRIYTGLLQFNNRRKLRFRNGQRVWGDTSPKKGYEPSGRG